MNKRQYLFNTKNYFDIFYKDNIKRPIVLIIPGGGYHHCSKKESMPISDVYQKMGFHTAILQYREELLTHPEPLMEILYTVDYLRKDSLVDSNRVILIGFSAGAHMIGMLSNHYMEYKEYNSRPDLCILCYPVITSDSRYWHKGSYEYLLGKENMTEEMLQYTDIAKSCHKKFPPTFIWHSADDNSVVLENSIAMVKALKDNNIKFEYHIYPHALHGSSLGTLESAMGELEKVNPYIQTWPEMTYKFIKDTLF
ncbi:MAG: alpha/beta hydrolase [Anaeroplasmataceae bacterium]